MNTEFPCGDIIHGKGIQFYFDTKLFLCSYITSIPFHIPKWEIWTFETIELLKTKILLLSQVKVEYRFLFYDHNLLSVIILLKIYHWVMFMYINKHDIVQPILWLMPITITFGASWTKTINLISEYELGSNFHGTENRIA